MRIISRVETVDNGVNMARFIFRQMEQKWAEGISAWTCSAPCGLYNHSPRGYRGGLTLLPGRYDKRRNTNLIT
jgi:hypothetical protein